MNIRIQVLIVAVALLCMFYVINKIRNKGIELKYSLIWLALGVGILLYLFSTADKVAGTYARESVSQ